MGIIDTLSAGFSAVNRRLWVIAIPVFLDLFLWLGPKLTATELVQSFFKAYADLSARSASGMSGQAEASAQLAQMGEQLSGLDFFNVLAWQFPSLMNAQLADPPVGILNMPVLTIDGGLVLVGLVFGLGLLGLLIQSAYLGSIAHAIRAGESSLSGVIGKLGLYWARLIAYFGLLVVAFIVVGMPVIGITALIGLLSPVVASLMAGLLVAVMMWIALYLFFAITAMFVSDVGPLKGAWYSFSVVRRYFWSAIGLIVLMLVIRFGMSRIWGLVLGDPVGVTGAILGNAYIEAGFAAASMIYYRDRYAKWREDSERIKTQAQQA